MAYADVFVPKLLNTNEVLNAGSILLVKDVEGANEEPIIHTLTEASGSVAGDEQLILTSSHTEGTRLRAGCVLHFVNGVAVVLKETLVTDSIVVPVEPLENSIPTGDTAQTWAMLQILSPTNLPTNIESQEVNRTDLSNGLFGSMVKTKIELNPQVTVINTPEDRALYEYIFPAAKSDKSVYALIVRSGGIHSFARALINGWNDDGNIEEISRPQFTVKYQGKIGISSPFKYLSTEEKAALNSVRRLSGLNVLI